MEQSGQDICLFSRRRMELTGIEEVESFTDEQITVESSLGMIAIEGKNLKIESFRTECGSLIVNGEFDSLYYYGKQENGEKRGIFSKLFR
ncbi:MAG: sporulation protein YabP [Clostridia bacterium]|nr:sporulation protein YabP [Oscillospiraceae bacterium]MBO5258204.1 sporulation protein YabP [Clostridia bacterium]